MAITSGTRLGPYEIIGLLGAGGMGEVYRAADPRLGREVAIKVLPEALRTDPERLRRFEQEARAAGALNHPNVLVVLDVGTHEGVPYVVSELLEGETLRQRLRVGGLTPTKAVECGVQIARGLAAAHDKGIVHRDLKPENLFLTRGGHAKILDFGLAKLSEPRREGEAGSEPETLSRSTEPGMVLGTVGYMSPEQVRGHPVDHRSDIFSLGAVLYEMLSQRRAFLGESAPEVLTAILREDPPELSSSERYIPPGLARIVQRCLEKKPEERFRSAHDLALALEAVSGSSQEPSGKITRQSRIPAASPLLGLVAIAAAALSALLAARLYLKPAGADLSRYRFTPLATDVEQEEEAAWSPDGRSTAYAKVRDGQEQIFVRSLDADSPVQVTRVTAGANLPFWSPDSSRIWFLSDDQVWSVGRAGGEPELVQKELVEAAALSPDGKTLATWRVTTAKNVTTSSVWLASPPLAEPREYTPAPFGAKGGWVPVYMRFSPDGTQILAAFYDAESVAVWLLPFPDGAGGRGKPQPIFSRNRPWQGPPSFSWMPDSRHAVMAFRDTAGSPYRLWMADTRTETLVALTTGVTDESQPDVSPDGSRIVFTSGGVDHDLAEVPLDGSPLRNVLATSRNEHSAAWVPGATRFVYMTDRSGQEEIRLRSGTENWERPIVTARDFPNDTGLVLRAPVVSPDGERVAYDRRPTNGSMAIWVSPVAGGAPVRLIRTAAEHHSPAWSPDGQWLAFFLTEGGVEKLAKCRVGSSEPPQTLVEGQMAPVIPVWSPKGDWIAYANADGVNVVSPDAKNQHLLAKVAGRALLWSRDGATIYTVVPRLEGGAQLVSVDVRAGGVKSISNLEPDVRFGTPTFPGQRFTLSPDGRSFLATIRRTQMDLWLLEGFDERRGFLDWFRQPRSESPSS